MSELLKVYYLFSHTRTCFFYRNDLDLRSKKSVTFGIKIQFGENYENTTYGSISQQPLSEVPSKCIGLSPLLANKLGLEENEEVLVSHCDMDSVAALQISPRKEEDYVILLSFKTVLETHLLNQILVVAEGQTLPFYVFSNIVIDVEIGKLESKSDYGQLEKFTEIIILHPSEKPEKYIRSVKNKSENKFEPIFNQLNKILENVSFPTEPTEDEIILKRLLQPNEINVLEYKIKPSFTLVDDIPKEIQKRSIIVSDLKGIKNSFGPHSIKMFSKVQKVKAKQTTDGKEDNGEQVEENPVVIYTFVVSLNSGEDMTAFCPQHVMKKLKLYAGSRITIEEIKPNLNLLESNYMEVEREAENCFWSSMADIREKTKKIIINNIRFNHKINTLVLGGLGKGKTILLQDIVNEFTSDFIYCKVIHCKTLRGKKMETLQKLWTDYFRDCCSHEPSLLVLDDLHALTYVDDEEEKFNKLYSNRVVDFISDCLIDFQGKYNISVVASAVSMPQLSGLVSTHGPRLFQNINKIPEMSLRERSFALENLVASKTKNRVSSLDLKKVAESTNGFSIQDLSDLVDKAVFNCLLRNESDENASGMSQMDFDSVLPESTPLLLRGIKLRGDIDKKWEDVGGMREPKKILSEVFSWPSKYPKLLESCPLRLQRGVLLYGAPGTGKTMLAGALANKCGLNFISVKGPEVLSKYVGASEEGIRSLFLQAQKTQPCLLFFDEFDSLAPKRGHDSTGVTDRVVNQLLTQLDGVEVLNGVWVLAATSRPDMLDPALLRPGRLDKMVFCSVPDQMDRLEILEALSRNLTTADDVELSEIAEKTEGYTGADIKAILYNAQMLAVKVRKNDLRNGTKLKITQNYFLAAVSETKPSLSKSEKVKYEKIYEKFLNSRKRNFVSDCPGTQKVTFA